MDSQIKSTNQKQTAAVMNDFLLVRGVIQGRMDTVLSCLEGYYTPEILPPLCRLAIIHEFHCIHKMLSAVQTLHSDVYLCALSKDDNVGGGGGGSQEGEEGDDSDYDYDEMFTFEDAQAASDPDHQLEILTHIADSNAARRRGGSKTTSVAAAVDSPAWVDVLETILDGNIELVVTMLQNDFLVVGGSGGAPRSDHKDF